MASELWTFALGLLVGLVVAWRLHQRGLLRGIREGREAQIAINAGRNREAYESALSEVELNERFDEGYEAGFQYGRRAFRPPPRTEQ